MSKPRRRGGLSSSGTSSTAGGGSNSTVPNSCSTALGGSDSTNNLNAATTSGTTSSGMTVLASSTSASIVATNSSSLLVGGTSSSSYTPAVVGRAPRSKVSLVKQAETDDVDHYEETSVTHTTTIVTTAKGGRKKRRAKRGVSNKEDRFPVLEPPLLTTTSSTTVGRPKAGGTTASTSTLAYENNTSPTPATASGAATSSSGTRAIHRKGSSSGTNKANSSSSTTAATAATKRGSTSVVTASSAIGAKDEHRATSTSHATTNDARTNSSSVSPICVDPGSLTRGMTARKIGHCVASMVRGLNSQQVQADLELMDAYTEACRVYSQKYFAYRNPDLCRIVDDTTDTVAYVGIQQLYATTTTSTAAAATPTDSDATSLPAVSNITNTENAPIEPTSSPSSTQPNIVSSPSSHQQVQQQQQQQQQRARWLYGTQQLMPTRIDPEEEKRIAALRQMISTQEKIREDLETQYTSLKANYIRELQLLQASKHENMVSLQLLQQLCYKRAKALALKRIRCQIFTDILACLLCRRVTIEELENPGGAIATTTTTPDDHKNDDDKTNSDKYTEDDTFNTAATNHANTTISNNNNMDKDVIMEDVVHAKVQLVPKLDSKDTIKELYKIWDLVESELNKAELDCTNLDIPDDILRNAILAQIIRNPPLNTGNSKAVATVEKDPEKVPSATTSNGGMSKDMTKGSMDIDTANNAKLEKRKYRRRAMSCGSVDDTGGTESTTKKNNTNPSKEDDVVAPSKVTPLASASVPSLTLPISITTNELAIPWRALTIPRTPRGVPLYISQLSSYPDKVAGASYGGFLGNKSTDMRYLLPLDRIHGCDNSAYGLPGSLHSNEIEIKEMVQLEMEISHLEASIREERQRNDKLQSLAIERKRKSDEICTAMMLLRSETENVLLRHNIILNSKEARLKSWEVVKEGRKDDASSINPSQVSDNHDDEEMIEEEEEEDFDGQTELLSCEAGAEEEEEEDGQAPEEEDDLDESELENSGYENEMDKEVGNTDVDDEGDEEENLGSSVDGEEEEEEDEEDDEEDVVSAPTANRSRRIVIRATANRPEASETEEDLDDEDEDTDVDAGGYDDQGSGNEGEINPSGDEGYSDDDEVDCNYDGVNSIGEEEPKNGSTSSENSSDISNNEENTADEDAGSEIDGEEMGDNEYESSEQFDSNIIKEI